MQKKPYRNFILHIIILMKTIIYHKHSQSFIPVLEITRVFLDIRERFFDIFCHFHFLGFLILFVSVDNTLV